MRKNKLLNVLRLATLSVAVICILIALIKGEFGAYWLIGWISMILSSIISLSIHKLVKNN
ncbi:hypothetical protein [Clostridium senegalense]|uniref:hypothetical protein n=1 Tax=Clostridium senegalense TaxID=1465809 RepID=UPI001C115CFC|nr:hypothetical protein [Clostridium senegalense]MBU5227930.1 hypothetical protein [Clostridium senegalense]